MRNVIKRLCVCALGACAVLFPACSGDIAKYLLPAGLAVLQQFTGGCVAPVASPAVAPSQDAHQQTGVSPTQNAPVANSNSNSATGGAANPQTTINIGQPAKSEPATRPG